MKYQITVDVENSPEVDAAALSSVLSYVITSSVKQIPGVLSSTVEALINVPADPVVDPPADPVEDVPVE